MDNFRVFYDIEGHEVQILAVISKDQAAPWLQAFDLDFLRCVSEARADFRADRSIRLEDIPI